MPIYGVHDCNDFEMVFFLFIFCYLSIFMDGYNLVVIVPGQILSPLMLLNATEKVIFGNNLPRNFAIVMMPTLLFL